MNINGGSISFKAIIPNLDQVIGFLRGSIDAFSGGMGEAVKASQQFNVSLGVAQEALKTSAVTGMRLKDAIEQVKDINVKNTAQDEKNVKLMTEWNMLADKLSEIYEDIGGALLESIAPAFPYLVAWARFFADVFIKQILPALQQFGKTVLGIGPQTEEAGNRLSTEMKYAVEKAKIYFEGFFDYLTKKWNDISSTASSVWNSTTKLAARISTDAAVAMMSKGQIKEVEKIQVAEIDRLSKKGIVDAKKIEELRAWAVNEVLGRSDNSTNDEASRNKAEKEFRDRADERQKRLDMIGAERFFGRAGNDFVASTKKILSFFDGQGSKKPKEDDLTKNWQAEVDKYAKLAMKPINKEEKDKEKKTDEVFGKEKKTASDIFGTFSSIGVAQLGGQSVQARNEQIQQQQLAALYAVVSGITKLVSTASGSLISNSVGTPTKTAVFSSYL